MKQFRIFLICLIYNIICNSYSQSQWKNQIPNYSFEKHDLSNWKTGLNGTNDPDNTPGNDYQNQVDYWSPIDEWTHPLKRFPCIFHNTPKIPTADLHISTYWGDKARSGTSWGNTSGEYLIVPTKNYENGGLQAGQMYYLEIFHNGTGNKNKVIAYEKQPKACGWHKRLYEYNANKEHNFLLEFDASTSSGWTRYRGYFSPTSNKNWVSFGNYGEWDDIRIYEVQPNKCRDNWYFDNTVFNYPMEVFQASNNIYIGNGVDPENGANHIASDVIQYASSNVIISLKSSIQKLRI